MESDDVLPKTHREALQSLFDCALACASPRSNTPKTRQKLRHACDNVLKFLSAPEVPTDFDFTDAEILVQTFISQKGEWRDLVAAVTRNTYNRKMTD